MPRSSYIAKLQESIQATRKCKALHATSVSVVERVGDQIVWEGLVEIFVVDHPQAKRCYAWGYDDGGTLLITSVLGVPPVTDAQSAVKVAIAARRKP